MGDVVVAESDELDDELLAIRMRTDNVPSAPCGDVRE